MTRHFWPVALAASLAAGCGGDAPMQSSHDAPAGIERKASAIERELGPSVRDLSELARGNQAFAFDVLHKLAELKPNVNIVFSPYSVSTALAMTYAGARGTTAAEMKQTLHFTLDQAPLHEAFNALELALSERGQGKVGADGTPFRLNVNNSLWAQRGESIVPTFLDTLALNYGAGLFLANFSSEPEPARKAINAWVSDKTEKLVPELLPERSITSNTRFVLTNTVYFNASWQTTFEEDATSDATFTKPNGDTVQVAMMHAGRDMPYAKGDNYEAVALPYADADLAFIAVLPDENAYPSVERAANAEWFTGLRDQLKPSGVMLALPKLDYTTQTSLKTTLRALGMQAAFDGADFSGMTEGAVRIDDVIHDAVIKVFEGGTIAAAATAVIFKDSSVTLVDHTVTFDRPFLFALVDQPTGQIVFLGRVLDPSAGKP